MNGLSHSEIVTLLMAMSTMLLLAKAGAELAVRIKLPAVLGEILMGIILGPSLLGSIFPDLFKVLFSTKGAASFALDGIIQVSIIMFLFVAGMEIRLKLLKNNKFTVILTGILSVVVPFVVGFAAGWFFPNFMGNTSEESRLLFAMFLGTALSISALPVIARILMDLGISRTQAGVVILASAMISDLIGWMIFSLILSSMERDPDHLKLGYTLILIISFGVFMLVIGKRVIDRSLPWIRENLTWPGSFIAICLGTCFLSAAFTQIINIHAILGAFIAGIAFGDSEHFQEKEKEIITQFVTSVFAPFFFINIGLHVNFIEHFDGILLLAILVLAFFGKIAGASFGAYASGLKPKLSLAIGFGLNARGAMEIILATIALEAELIGEKLFVALVLMALITSITSGPLIKKFHKINEGQN